MNYAFDIMWNDFNNGYITGVTNSNNVSPTTYNIPPLPCTDLTDFNSNSLYKTFHIILILLVYISDLIRDLISKQRPSCRDSRVHRNRILQILKTTETLVTYCCYLPNKKNQ